MTRMTPWSKEKVPFTLIDAPDVAQDIHDSIDAMSEVDSWYIKAMEIGVLGVSSLVFKKLSGRKNGLLLPDAWSLHGPDSDALASVMDDVNKPPEGYAHFQNNGFLAKLLFFGRDHRKAYGFGRVAYIGGMNFNNEAFERTHDYLLKTKNEIVAANIRAIIDPRSETYLGKRKNAVHQVDPGQCLLFEGESPFSSPIMRQAIKIGAAAVDESVYYVSQTQPTGRLGWSVTAKQARPPVYNHHDHHDRRAMRLVERIQSIAPFIAHSTRQPDEQKVHAKTLVAKVENLELPNGERYSGWVSLSGSHNYTHSGILAGTQEMALLSTDQALIEQQLEWIEKKFPLVST